MKILICDRDGTLTTSKRGHFVNAVSDLQPIPGAAGAIQKYSRDGWKISIASNQGGCEALSADTGRQFLSKRTAANIMRRCLSFFPEIDRAYFCPNATGLGQEVIIVRRPLWLWAIHEYGAFGDHPYYQYAYRKPECGMLQLAVHQLQEKEWQTWYQDARENLRRDALAEEYLARGTELLYVGDRPEDKQAASKFAECADKNVTVNFMWAKDWWINGN
ncbi:MAG: hypothetical protein AAF215_33630 [Cyanobacteria bacterium P01_A01_bin.123]